MGTFSLDPQAVRMAADRLEAAADILQGVLGTHLAALPAGAEDLRAGVARWETGARDLATALRAAVDRHAESETNRARALR